MPNNQLVLLFDGTGCSFSSNTNVEVLRVALGFNLTKLQKTENIAAGTEIDKYKLDGDSKRLVIYQEGLGAPPLFKKKTEWGYSPTQIYNKLVDLLGLLPEAAAQIEALGIIENIKHGYKFLVFNYTPGDQIFSFGFSRGSYTLRLLYNLIKDVGLIDPKEFSSKYAVNQAIEQIFQIYQESATLKDNPQLKMFAGKFYNTDGLIQFAGLFESVPGPIAEKVHKSARLGKVVKVFRHAVAVDERRLQFATEIVIPDEDVDFEQKWFPGSHGDVGGGYPSAERGLANVSLRWMVDEANKHGLNLNPLSIAEYLPDPLDLLHDSRAEEIAPGIKWSEVTFACRRPIALTAKESFHTSIFERFGKTVKSDADSQATKYTPSNLSHAFRGLLNAFELFQLDSKQEQGEVAALCDVFKVLPPADELSDAEDDEAEDILKPVIPSLVPPFRGC